MKESQDRKAHADWDTWEEETILIHWETQEHIERKAAGAHYTHQQYQQMHPEGLAMNPTHREMTNKAGVPGVFIPNENAGTQIEFAHVESITRESQVGNTKTADLWRLLEKQKLIASNLGGGQAMRNGTIPSGDKLRAMLLVAAGDEPGTLKLVESNSPALARGQAPDASRSQAPVARGQAAPKRKGKLAAPAGRHVPSPTPAPAPPPKGGGGGRGRPAHDVIKMCDAKLEAFGSSEPDDPEWWGAEALTTKKELSSLLGKFDDRIAKPKHGDDMEAFTAGKKSVECMIMAIDLGQSGLDAASFKHSYDEVDTKKLLPPTIPFPWPRHVLAARRAADIRECTVRDKCWSLLAQCEHNQQVSCLCERIDAQWKCKESVYTTKDMKKFFDIEDGQLDKLEALQQDFVVAMQVGLAADDYPDMNERRDLVRDAHATLRDDSEMSKHLRAWPRGNHFVLALKTHAKKLDLTIERVAGLKAALATWKNTFQGKNLMTIELQEDFECMGPMGPMDLMDLMDPMGPMGSMDPMSPMDLMAPVAPWTLWTL